MVCEITNYTLNGYIKFAKKFVTRRNKRRRPYEIYIVFSHGRLSAYTRTSSSVLKISIWNFAHVLFSLSSILRIVPIGPLLHIWGCHTNWMIKMEFLYGYFCICAAYSLCGETEVNVFFLFCTRLWIVVLYCFVCNTLAIYPLSQKCMYVCL